MDWGDAIGKAEVDIVYGDGKARIMSSDQAARQDVSLGEFIESINPGWVLEDWLHWPPDAFALTSIVLGDSGVYRYTVSPPFTVKDWPEADWSSRTSEMSLSWRRWLGGLDEELDRELVVLFKTLQDLAPRVLVKNLFSASKIRVEDDVWKLCECLIALHAVADQACEGFGIHRTWEGQQDLMHLHMVANLLLTARGTLSCLPRSRGVVLPRMRTPQVGLTLRSLSHHLTFHRTEVDIAWRAAPWMNREEDTVNILVVPWPYEVDATYFKPVHHPGGSQRLGTARYFSYARTKSAAPFDPESIVRLIEDASGEVRRIHLLVFPEASLTGADLRALKYELGVSFKLDRDRIPIIIAGIADSTAKSDSSSTALGAEDLRTSGIGAFHRNSVSLSVFYGEKWYELSQDKHHRWRLDGNQIRQYELGGVLTGGKVWWEAINIPKRRLTFFAPNTWLTICPLICEDLARLDPVSELIRGVGPTLLIALLLDGPQLMQRWPGRYASVLADDPGSSVLTVTSLGLCKRSISRSAPDGGKSRVIALWKDQVRGRREIELPEGKDGVVLTVSATWTEEETCDGRRDSANAAVLVLQGCFGVSAAVLEKRTGDGKVNGEENAHAQQVPEAQFSDGHDFIELTLWTYFVNAALDGENRKFSSELGRWLANVEEGTECGREAARFGKLLPLIRDGLRSCGADSREEPDAQAEIPSREFQYAMSLVGNMIESVNGDHPYRGSSREQRTDYLHQRWKSLVEAASNRLSEIHCKLREGRVADISADSLTAVKDPVRINISVPFSILWAVHHRLADRRRLGSLSIDGAKLLRAIEKTVSGYTLADLEEYLEIYKPLKLSR